MHMYGTVWAHFRATCHHGVHLQDRDTAWRASARPQSRGFWPLGYAVAMAVVSVGVDRTPALTRMACLKFPVSVMLQRAHVRTCLE